ncbi:glycosyltransferase family 4 protein [Halorientalis salina]|uniref:glycosyltransferase family 4 protein n=1 Tax=Halorientalis salina TaxID=2932266 RepID=UPI0010ABE30E|nr:glycosyltransferase family 4 protein [Halorientalis salina]
MRVAFVTEQTVFDDATEGRERLHRIATQLADRGHDVTVFCTRWWPDHDEFEARDGVTYRAVTDTKATPSFLARTPFLLARYRPDVIHAAPDPPKAVAAAGLGGTLARAPLVVEWFGDEDVPDSRWTRRAARKPATVVTPSELVRTAVREIGASTDNTRVIPESIDASLVADTEPDSDADIVYARDLDSDANVETLLLGLAELRQRDWSATIIGEGPQREAYERQAADLRIDDRVSFVGDLPREERVAVYKGAHTFVHTAYTENFATELLWALACGCVGIVQYQAESSAHELIEQYPRSFRVSDDEGITEAIEDAGRYERLDADSELAATYDHDEIIERYLDLYRDLQAEHGVF